MKKWLLIGLLVLCGLYTAYPYYSAQRTYNAIKDGDERALTHYIDWSALRENVKGQLVATDVVDIDADTLGEMFGGGLAALFTVRLIENLVTPAGLARVIRRHQGNGPDEPLSASDLEYAFFVENPFTFLVEMKRADNAVVSAVFRLKGGRWQLSEIFVPDIAESLLEPLLSWPTDAVFDAKKALKTLMSPPAALEEPGGSGYTRAERKELERLF